MSNVLKIRFDNKDPLLRFLRDKLRLNWWRAVLLYAFVWGIDTPLYTFVAGVFDKTQTPPGFGKTVVGFKGDLSTALIEMLWAGAVLLAYYVWSGNALSSLIWKLHLQGSLKTMSQQIAGNDDEHDLIWATDRLDRIWSRNGWWIICVAVALGWFFGIYKPRSYQASGTIDAKWYQYHQVYEWYWLAKMLFWIYVVSRILVMEVLGVYSVRQLAKWRVFKYSAFHSDHAGGLSLIGHYRLRVVYAAAGLSVFFLARAVPVLQNILAGTVSGSLADIGVEVPDLIELGMLVALVPLLYFWPLRATHAFMKEEKAKIVNSVGMKLERGLSKMAHSAQSALDSQVGEVTELNVLLERLRKAPEWPYNHPILRRFWGSWLLIAIPVLTDVTVQWLSKILGLAASS